MMGEGGRDCLKGRRRVVRGQRGRHLPQSPCDPEERPIGLANDGMATRGQRVAALRLSGLPLSTFLALLASLDSTGRAEITQPELGKLLSTGPGKVWQSLRALVAAGVIEPPVSRGGFGRRTPYRISPNVAVAPSVPPRPRSRRRICVPVDGQSEKVQ
jgi:hypothetical protein